ncbi:hypothetical protein [Mycobacterium sp.]|uniref:hypothetical protein n=1 Tax=Mycobacterium sp. TaxID=1785 RepID=UPI000CB1AA30|nr:hypothetical protein [Mycobacterium sp.]PJE02821.1 MAG: hypothetical protein CK428_29500 [Mycobacterium sp.]
MDVRWSAVLIFGAAALTAVTAWALLVPLVKTPVVRRPLAHVARLTGMPEYARLAALRFWSMLTTLGLLMALLAVALLITARPVGFSAATKNFEAAHPEDIMVCLGQPVTDPTTAGFLHYFAHQMGTFNTQRIGLTSPSLRVVPLTGDYEYAAAQFERFAALAGLQHQLDTTKELPGPQAEQLRMGINDFSREVNYLDYTRSVQDILALCMTGFPAFEDKSVRRRSVIYLGFNDIRDPRDARPTLFSDQQVKDMAAAGGIQINVISRADVLKSDQSSAAVAAIAAATDGRYSLYNPAGTAGPSMSATDANLAGVLTTVRDNPPGVVLASGTSITRRSWDYPNPVLIAALALTAVLSAALAVLRR